LRGARDGAGVIARGALELPVPAIAASVPACDLRFPSQRAASLPRFARSAAVP
jgi:hypothetical protein